MFTSDALGTWIASFGAKVRARKLFFIKHFF